MAVLKAIQSGSGTLASGVLSTTATITAVDPTKTILKVTYSAPIGTQAERILLSSELTNSTTITFARGSVAGSEIITFEWSVVEFISGVTVVHGSTNLATLPVDILLSPAVNLSTTFVVISFAAVISSNGNTGLPKAKITTTTNLNIDCLTALSTSIVKYQVITYDSSVVQTGDVSFAAGDLTKSASPAPTAAPADKSLIVFSYQGAGGTDLDLGQKCLTVTHAHTGNITSLTFEREHTGTTSTLTVTWYLIEFTDGNTVQSGQEPFTTAELQRDVALTAVDLSKSVDMIAGEWGSSGKYSRTSSDELSGLCVRSKITTTTNLQLIRGATQTETLGISWYVVTFGGDQLGGKISGAGFLSGVLDEDLFGLISGAGLALGNISLGPLGTIVTQDLTLINDADSNAGWGAVGPTAAPAAEPDVKIQGTNSISVKVSGLGVGGIVFDFGANTDISNSHVIAWFFTMQAINTEALGGVRIRVSSATDGGTNYGEWYVRGSDTNIGPRANFHPLAVDTSRAFDAQGGTPPALTAVRSIGVTSDLLSSNGRISYFVDIMRRGNGGLTITGGTNIAPCTSVKIAQDDELNANGYGLFARVGGTFLLQGLQKFGDILPNDSYFRETNKVWSFTGQPVSVTFNRIEIVGSPGNRNEFTLGTKVGTGIAASGISGVVVLAGGSAPFRFIASDPNITVNLYGGSFLNSSTVGGTIQLESAGIECLSWLFSSCDTITIRNGAIVRGATITDSTSLGTSAALDFGGVNPNAVADSTRDITIIGGVNGVLLKGTGNVTYDFPNINFSGQTGKKVRVDFGATDTVTINITGGGTPLTQADMDKVTAGTTVVINNNTSVTFDKLKDNTEVRVFNNATGVEIAGIENATSGTPDNRSFSWSAAAGLVVDYRIINITHVFPEVVGFTVPSADTTIDIVQSFDRNYANPV